MSVVRVVVVMVRKITKRIFCQVSTLAIAGDDGIVVSGKDKQ